MTNKCRMCGEWDKYPQYAQPCYPGREHNWIPMLELRSDMDEIKYLRGALLRIADETDANKMRNTARRVLASVGANCFRKKNPDLETLEAEIIE